MSALLNNILWQQFGAAIDMLDNAIQACPDDHWADVVWHDPEAAEFGQFWFVAYHTVMWTDLYLSGLTRKDFVPPAPFVNGSLPEQPYSKEDVSGYLAECREKCRSVLLGMSDERAAETYTFSWGGGMPFAELQLYTMRHVQEHASQLSLHLGHVTGSAPDWVSRAEWDRAE